MKTTHHKRQNRLSLHRETIRSLDPANLGRVAGGDTYATCVCSELCATKDCPTKGQLCTVGTLILSCRGLCAAQGY